MNGGGVFLSVCKLLLEYERTVLHRDQLRFVVDLQGNDAITDALIHGNDHVARYLLSIHDTDSSHSNDSAESINDCIERRTAEMTTKKSDDSKATRVRYE